MHQIIVQAVLVVIIVVCTGIAAKPRTLLAIDSQIQRLIVRGILGGLVVLPLLLLVLQLLLLGEREVEAGGGGAVGRGQVEGQLGGEQRQWVGAEEWVDSPLFRTGEHLSRRMVLLSHLYLTYRRQ